MEARHPGAAAPSPQRVSNASLAALLVGAWVGLALCDPIIRHPVAGLACYAGAFFAYALACRRMLADERVGRPWGLRLVIGTAVVCRLIAFPSTPSDDVHRYIWEGRVLAAGHNPYRLSPDSEELSALAAGAPEHVSINHPDWPAIYPPFMQWWQRAVVGLAADAWALKASFLIAELGLCIVLCLLLTRLQLPPARLLIYAWNPLAVQATASEGHHDVVAAALLMTTLLLLLRGRPASAATAFVCSVLAKGFALVALPALLSSRAARAAVGQLRGPGWARVLALPLLTVAALCLPFLLTPGGQPSSGGMFDSLQRFGAEMHTNDSLHALAAWVLPSGGSRLAMGIVWATVAMLVMRRGADDPLRACAVLLGTLLLVLPTVHPWYLVILLPFLCFFPWWGWIALSGTVALTWLPQLEIQRTGEWVEWRMIKILEYAPLFVWLGLVGLRWCRTARLPAAGLLKAPESRDDQAGTP